MSFKLFSNIALKKDFPQHGLRRGDIATIVDRHPANNGGEDGYSIEVFNAVGQTIMVLVVSESQIESLNENEVLHARQLQKTNDLY